MKDRNLLERTLTCVIGIPFVLCLVFFVPYYNYILFSTMVIVLSLLGSLEMSRILNEGRVTLAAYLAPLIPLVQYVLGLTGLKSGIADLLFVLILLTCFASEIIAGEKDNFEGSLLRCGKSALIVLYPSYFISFFLRLMSLEITNSLVIMTFLILVFGNDVLAYIFGRLFGKGNRGIIAVSPKKSAAGFVGSFLGTIGLAFACFALFADKLPDFPAVWKVVLGGSMSIAANVGDLIESVFKRSAKVKDSGKVIPGRGGALDCLDSSIAASPLFFIIFTLVTESL